MIAALRRCSIGLLSLSVSCLLAVPAFGQSSQWAPSRTTTRPGDVRVAGGSTAYVPEWQRSPQSAESERPVVRASSSMSAAGRGVQSSYSAGSQGPEIDIQLAPGEKLVGKPTYSEGRPMSAANSGLVTPRANPAPRVASSNTVSSSSSSRHPARQTSHFASHDEMLPVPDQVSTRRSASQGEIIYEQPHGEADVQFDPEFSFEHDGVIHGDCDSCVDGSCYGCTTGCRDDWGDPPACPECGMYAYHFPGCNRAAMCLENCYGFIFRESSVFVGVQSFKGPLDQGQNGNFGFSEGFNLVGPLVPFPRIGVGYQVGARWTQTNLHGNQFGSSSRNQSFVTAALFHRAYRNCGLQWGVAFDWLTDDYYVQTTTAQVRTEISWLFGCHHEIGFWGTSGVQNSDDAIPGLGNRRIKPIDQYNFYYRYTSDRGAQARFWGGVTESNFGVAGADFRVPMSNRADLVGGFNYIIPNDGGAAGAAQESWGLSMNLVWYFGRRKDGMHNTPFRPLFNVADSSVFMNEPL